MSICNYGFLLFQDPTEKIDDTNQDEESTEMPSSDENTASTGETDTIESDDDDTEDDDTETEEEDVLEPRGFPSPSGPEEEQESEDDHVVIEAKDNSDPRISFGIPPTSFWFGAPVFNPFVDNAIDREGTEGAEGDVAEPEQQARKVSLCFSLSFSVNFAQIPLTLTQPTGLLSTLGHGQSTHGRILLLGRVRRQPIPPRYQIISRGEHTHVRGGQHPNHRSSEVLNIRY